MLEGGFEGITTAFMLLEIQSRNTLQVFCLWLHSQPCNQSTLRAIFYLQQVFVLSAGEPTIRPTLHKSLPLLTENGVRECRFQSQIHGLHSVNILFMFPWRVGWVFCCHPRLHHWPLSRNALAGAWLRSTLQVVCSHPVLHSRSAAGQTQETRLVTLGTSAEECEQYTTGG